MQFPPYQPQWMLVTPELAAEWLRKNTHNRPLRRNVVEALARDIVAGNWVPTHQGVAFYDDETLFDGQHRLSAIVRAQKPVAVLVTFGIPKKQPGNTGPGDTVDRGNP